MFETSSSSRAARTTVRTLVCVSAASVCLLTSAGDAAAGSINRTQETTFVTPAAAARFDEISAQRRGGGVHRPMAARPNRGVRPNNNVVVRKNTVVRNTNAAVRPGGWARPGNYWWRPGGAVAAGAAIGFVSAATAAAWAGAPPAPGYCWYYTDQSRTQGFWDACP